MPVKDGKPEQKRVIIAAGKKIVKQADRCVMCGGAVEKGYVCKDRDIANILLKKGYSDHFCSLECFAKAAGIKEA